MNTIHCRQLRYCILGVLAVLSLQYHYMDHSKLAHVLQKILISLPKKGSQYATATSSTWSITETSDKHVVAHEPFGGPSCVRCHNNPLCMNRNKLVVFARMLAGAIWNFYLYGEEAKNCKMSDNVTCFFTDNSSYYPIADVLFINECKRPQTHPAYPEQLILRYNHEAEWKNCNNPTNDKLADLRISYTLSSALPYPYLCRADVKEQLLEVFKLKPPSRRKGVVMFVSNCHTGYSQWRYNYLKELMQYIHIDSYGDCMHNTNVTSSKHSSSNLAVVHSIKIDFIKINHYKFLISFENTLSPEYVTEKLWHAYLSQTIPIYYGAPEVYNQVPGKNTFIDAAKFFGPKELADYIKRVDQDETLYQSYFNFNTSVTVNYQKNCPLQSLGCAICNRMYQLKQNRCNT